MSSPDTGPLGAGGAGGMAKEQAAARFSTSAPTDSVLEQSMARMRAKKKAAAAAAQGAAVAVAGAAGGASGKGSGNDDDQDEEQLASPPIVTPPPTGMVGSPELAPMPFAGMVRSKTVTGTKASALGLSLGLPSTGSSTAISTMAAVAGSSAMATGASSPALGGRGGSLGAGVSLGMGAGGVGAGAAGGGGGGAGGGTAGQDGPVMMMKRASTVTSMAGLSLSKRGAGAGEGGSATTTRGVTEEGKGILVTMATSSGLDFATALDERARSQLAQNLWWRSWSMNYQRHHRRNRSTESVASAASLASAASVGSASLDMSGIPPSRSSGPAAGASASPAGAGASAGQPGSWEEDEGEAAGGNGRGGGGRRGREGSQDSTSTARSGLDAEGSVNGLAPVGRLRESTSTGQFSSSGGVSVGGRGEEESHYYQAQYEEGMTPVISAATDALSVEGMGGRHDHKKQWEEYYQIFLQRYCTTAPVAAAARSGQGSAGVEGGGGGAGQEGLAKTVLVVHKDDLVARLSGISQHSSSSSIPGASDTATTGPLEAPREGSPSSLSVLRVADKTVALPLDVPALGGATSTAAAAAAAATTTASLPLSIDRLMIHDQDVDFDPRESAARGGGGGSGDGSGGMMIMGEGVGGEGLDESVHGGNLFAAFMRSQEAGAINTLPTPNSSAEDFRNYAFPWELPGGPSADGPVASAGGGGSGHQGPGGPGDFSTLPRPPLRTIDSGEELGPHPIDGGAIGTKGGAGGLAGACEGGAGLGALRSVSEGAAGSGGPAVTAGNSTTTTTSSIETILKKAFTGFHNSSKFGQDNASAYLGDDLSVRGNGVFGASGVFGPNSAYSTSPASTSGSGSGYYYYHQHHQQQGLRMHRSDSLSKVSPAGAAGPAFTAAAMPRNRSFSSKEGAAVGSAAAGGGGGGGAAGAGATSGSGGGSSGGFDPSALLHHHPSQHLSKKPVLLAVRDCSSWKRDEQYWLLPAVMAACRDELAYDEAPEGDKAAGTGSAGGVRADGSGRKGHSDSLLAHALSVYGDKEATQAMDVRYARDPELDRPSPTPPSGDGEGAGDAEDGAGMSLSMSLGSTSSLKSHQHQHHALPHPYDPFQTYLLGEVLVSSTSLLLSEGYPPPQHESLSMRQLPQRWEVRVLVVKQNFLLEYLPHDLKAPVGFIHLEGCTASPRLDNRSIVHLTCRPDSCRMPLLALKQQQQQGQGQGGQPLAPHQQQQPSSTAPKKHITLIRTRSHTQAGLWCALLEKASKITTEDLFEYLPIKPQPPAQGQAQQGAPSLSGTALLKASELGRGRFAVVRKARRRHYDGSDAHDDDVDHHHHHPEHLPDGHSHGHSRSLSHSHSSLLGPAVTAGGAGDAVCALKIVNKAAFWTRVAEGKERHDTLVREVVAQAVLTAHGSTEAGGPGGGCPIVRLYSAFETVDSLVLELELMSRNDLFDELSTSGVLRESKTAQIVHQVVRAVAFCAEHHIAHRDVKLSNIIFPLQDQEVPHPPTTPQQSQSQAQQQQQQQQQPSPPPPPPSAASSSSSSSGGGGGGGGAGGRSPFVKLADFGMAGFFGKDQTLRGRCGTPGYVAPEILCAGVNEGYGTNVDIFSVGVVAYTLLCGYEPFYGVTDKQLIAANKLAEYEFHDPEWTRISAEAKDLVSKMLVRDPRKRITPKQALDHPWLRRFSAAAAAATATIATTPAAAALTAGAAAALRASGSSTGLFQMDVVAEGDETADDDEEEEEEEEEQGQQGHEADSVGVAASPQTSVSLLRKQRPDMQTRLAAAADKAERLGGCAERAQYGAPLCTIS